MKSYLFVGILFLLIHNIGNSQENLNIHPDLIKHLNPSLAPFYHGVASGDPTNNSVVIWTKLTLDKSVKEASVNWEISKDSLFSQIIQQGISITNTDKDFTVKERIENLKSNQTLYYRFENKGSYSIIGKTKTLPSKLNSYKIAFAACSNYEWGYFTNYKYIAEDKTIDLVVHLGDYIYEYGIGIYGDTSIGRINIPSHEIISLYDYRTRYSLYRLDKDLMKLHQMKPIITTWDDHEIADNAYNEGAENHQENEGSYINRKNAATQAYYEWLPIHPKLNEPLYRSFSIGSLINLIVLDTRIEERTVQVDSAEIVNYFDSTRTILGKKQFSWLTQNLKQKETWKIICNQVPVGPMYSPSKIKDNLYMDGWDGYPFEKEKFLHFLGDNKIKNTVIVTGDYHRSIAMETDSKGTKTKDDNVAVEFIVTSITSANDDEYYTLEKAQRRKELYLINNPNMKYCNNIDNGYLTLKINKKSVIAEYLDISTVKKSEAIQFLDKRFKVEAGKNVLIE